MSRDIQALGKEILLFAIMAHLSLILFPSSAAAKREHLVYFPNTAYELNIYKSYGKQPGKTLMLIGGIQGNEPGGFLSADTYADMRIEKGNLIVVPRANFYSIIMNHRGPHGDMNRKFTHRDADLSMEDKIVTILKKLISESDYLLNLHDGYGYYYPEYLSKSRNPMCFGQAIIADCDLYRIPGTDRVIKLGQMAAKVIEEINPNITDSLHKYHFMNTKTDDTNSPHREQRMSATYYALTKHHIPAFGVETSKFLPTTDLKVQYHNLIINSFMKLFDIVPESPGRNLDAPVLKYLVVSINGQMPVVVKENQTLNLAAGDAINVSHIEANYDRGLSLDILETGDLNDFRKDFKIFKDTKMIVRKDNQKFGEIPIVIAGQRPVDFKKGTRIPKIDYFVVAKEGQNLLLSSGETLELVRGDRVRIVDILPKAINSQDIKVNFRGFVGDWKNNTGEDRGYTIDTGTDLIHSYSLNKKGELYEIVATLHEEVLGKMNIKLSPPRLDYLIFKINDQRHLYLKPNDRISLSGEDDILLEEIQTNLFDKKGIHLSINGQEIGLGQRRKIKALCTSSKNSDYQIRVVKGPIVLGSIFISMN
jgi:hypothetical protein